MRQEVASKAPGLAIVGTRSQLTWISPHVSGREGDIGTVSLIVEFRRNKKAGEWGRHALFASVSYLAVGTVPRRSQITLGGRTSVA
jgi:hypothetical protein